MDKCRMPGCLKDAKETHHIKERKDADENGNIGSIHKNNLNNFVLQKHWKSVSMETWD